jgi:hypothetical protein
MRVTEETAPAGLPLFWRDPLMWLGFSLSAFYNALNMFNAFFPQVPAPGKFYDLGQFFTAPPLDALRPLTLHYRPEVIGLGYLMPTEVAFTVWLSYALFKVEALIGRMLGWQFAGFPFTQEQGLGAYLTVAALLIYAARHYLRDWAKRLWNDDANADAALRPKEAALWLLVGVVGCLTFMVMAGMDWRIAAIYLALTLLVALVYARIRAEVGAPMVWLFPYYQHKKAILYTLGVNRVMGLGGLRNMTAFAIFTFLSRGLFSLLHGDAIGEHPIGQSGHFLSTPLGSLERRRHRRRGADGLLLSSDTLLRQRRRQLAGRGHLGALDCIQRIQRHR